MRERGRGGREGGEEKRWITGQTRMEDFPLTPQKFVQTCLEIMCWCLLIFVLHRALNHIHVFLHHTEKKNNMDLSSYKFLGWEKILFRFEQRVIIPATGV